MKTLGDAINEFDDIKLSNKQLKKLMDDFKHNQEIDKFEKKYSEKIRENLQNLTITNNVVDSSNNPVYTELLDLYNLIENTVLNYIENNPKLLDTILIESENQINISKCKNKPFVSFGLTIEDVLYKLIDRSYMSDLYCGFKVGNKEISIC